ncbi:MAG: FAD-dependent oxidoreductase [Candidatus Omnitrophota bacterium]
MIYDLIIIGAGPAGITAAVYAARKNLNFIIVTGDIGGQTAWSGDIENYTGYQFITGPELTAKFEEHMRQYNVQVKENEQVIDIERINNNFLVKTNKEEYSAKTVIVASGKRSKELNILGEKEFKNHGLTYCATCDAPLFKGKRVAVIGGGNSALDAVLQLIKIAKYIHLINIEKDITGDAIMYEKIRESKIVTVLNNTKVIEIIGDKMVNAIKVETQLIDSSQEQILDVEGVFVEIGLIPNSGFAGILEKNQYNEIKVNCHNETNIPGIFSAGDVTDVPEKQIIIAAGEGSKAALGAFRYLSTHK